MLKFIRRIAVAVWTLFLVHLILYFLKKWLGENYFSDPNAAVAIIFNFVASIAHQNWFQIVLAVLTGIGIGALFDRFARQPDDDKASKLQTLGFEFSHLATDITNAHQSYRSNWPDNVLGL